MTHAAGVFNPATPRRGGQPCLDISTSTLNVSTFRWQARRIPPDTLSCAAFAWFALSSPAGKWYLVRGVPQVCELSPSRLKLDPSTLKAYSLNYLNIFSISYEESPAGHPEFA